MCAYYRVYHHVTRAQKSDQNKEEDCALRWELFPQPWFSKLLHTMVTFLWLSPQLNIYCRSQPQHPCHTVGPWLLMPAMELHSWDKAVWQDASSEYPLTPLSKAKCLLFFSVWRLNRIGELSVSGKYWLSLTFELNLLQLATQTWLEIDVLGFFVTVMLVVHIPPDLEGKPY